MTDVSDTLTELEHKLKDLERELTAAHADSATPEPVVPTPVAPLAAADTRVTLGALRGELDDLDRFRARLEESSSGLMAEYERLLEAVRATEPPAAPEPRVPAAAVPPAEPLAFVPPAMPPAPPAPEPAAPAVAVVPAPPEPPAPPPAAPALRPVVVAPARPPADPPAVAPDPSAHVLSGELLLDAGPFADIGALARFERLLDGVPQVSRVYVRGFDDDRAQIDVTLAEPVALGAALGSAGATAVRITGVVGQRVTLAVAE